MLLLFSGGDAPDLAPVQTTVSTTTVVAVAIAMLVALLIVIDVSCYFINACGLTMCVCVHLCGHESAAASTKPTSDKDVDDPERYDSVGDLTKKQDIICHLDAVGSADCKTVLLIQVQ